MKYFLSALVVLLSTALPIRSASAQAAPFPSIDEVLKEDFAPLTQAWQTASGHWAASNGFYVSDFTGETDIATITLYPGTNPASPNSAQLHLSEYILRARMKNSGTVDGREVGFVFGYQDAQNYHEVVVNPFDTVRLRTVLNGVKVREQNVASVNGSRNQWFDLELYYRNGTITVKGNGRRGTANVAVPEFPDGQVGLVTHGVVGRFDKLFIGMPTGEQNFYEDFTFAPYVTFEPKAGQWATLPGGGMYGNTAVQQTAISLAPVTTIGTGPGQISEYAFAAQVVNPYKGAGNLVGLVFNYTSLGYYEVVFSPTGVASFNRFQNGKVTTLATASYHGGPQVRFAVALEIGADRTAVVVDGVPLFENVVPPSAAWNGRLGFVTHWSQGFFDDVQFHRDTSSSCSFGFSNPPPSRWIVSGTWNTNGGTLNDTTLGANDIVDFKCPVNSTNDETANDFVLRARVLNPHSGAGNRVGLIVNYQDASSFYAGDYYEVAFTGTGVMQINKVINGVVQPFGSVQLNLPPNTFFNVEFHRSGIWARVKVNGVDVFPSLFMGALSGGSVGVITHFAKGRFDNVALSGGGSQPML